MRWRGSARSTRRSRPPPRPPGPRGPQAAGRRRAHRGDQGALGVRRRVDHPAVGVLRRVRGRAALGPRDPLPPPLVQPRGPGGADRAAARRVGHGRGLGDRHGQRTHPARQCGQTQRAVLAGDARGADERAVRDEPGHGRRRRRGVVGTARPDRPAVRRTPAHPPARALRRRTPRGAPVGRRPGAHHPHPHLAARAGDLRPARLLAAHAGQFGPRRRKAGHHGLRP